MRLAVSMVALLGCVTALAPTLAAQGNCSLQTIQGTYVVAVNGFFGTAPYSVLGTVKNAADGTTLANVTVALPSGSFEQTSSGTLAVSPDCRATATYPEFTEEMLILRNGEEIRVLLVDPVTYGPWPRVQSGTAYRLSPGANTVNSCSPAMVAGAYSQSCTGWFVPPGSTTFLPLGFLATLSIDGKTSFSGSGTWIAAGMKVPSVYQGGSYTLASDCRGTASFQFQGNPALYTERFLVFDQGKEMVSITTSGQQIDMCRFTRMGR